MRRTKKISLLQKLKHSLNKGGSYFMCVHMIRIENKSIDIILSELWKDRVKSKLLHGSHTPNKLGRLAWYNDGHKGKSLRITNINRTIKRLQKEIENERV